MASGFDSNKPIADGVIFWLTDSLGTRELRHIETASVTRDGETTVIRGPSGIIGMQDSAKGSGSISLTSRRSKTVAEEADYLGLWRNGELIEFDYQILDGSRHRFRCKVSTVGDEVGADSSVTRPITLVFDRETEIPV